MTIGFIDEQFLLPFSAKVDALNCHFLCNNVRQPENFNTLDIATKDLSITFTRDLLEAVDLTGLLISLFNRVACLGHFERLAFTMIGPIELTDTIPVVQALIGAINANRHLAHLTLCDCPNLFGRSTPSAEGILHAIGEHKRLREVFLLRELVLGPEKDDFSSLKRLLSRNRNLTVFDTSGSKLTNGTTIEKLYALNRFFNGSEKLGPEPAELQPLLFATALVESTSANHQYTSLLLSNHADMLWEFIDSLNIDTTDDGVDARIVTEDTSAV